MPGRPRQWSTQARGFWSPARRFSAGRTGRRQWKRSVPLFRPEWHERHGGNLRSIRLALIAVMVVSLAACRHGNQQQTHSSLRTTPVDREMLKLSKEQIFQRGEEWFAKKKWAKARTYYQHLYENFPNEPLGRRSLLRLADTYYQQGDAVNLVEAQYKYRDFINRYPGSESADYAMLQIAMCSYEQMEKPDRDQQKTREALEKFNDMLGTYPKSPLAAQATKRRQDVLDHLAKHDHIV